MEKKKYHNYVSRVNREIERQILADDSTYNGVRFNSLAPTKELFYRMCLKAERDEAYYNQFTKWIKCGDTMLTREVCSHFEKEIDKMFTHNKYPLPFQNAEERLSLIAWRL